MSQQDKPVHAETQTLQAGAIEKGRKQKRVVRPEAVPRAWATGNQVYGAGMKMSAGRKVPSGPVGGSGRKTNLARSS